MARKPDIKSDRDDWGAVLNDYLDVSLAEDGTIREAAAAPAIAAGTTAAYSALDIWPEFDSAGGEDSWVADTYANYIAGFETSLAGAISSGDVSKTTLGDDSGDTPVYSYEAGNGSVDVFVMAGQHATETVGMFASMRWFERFVTSDDILMRRLRKAFRVTYVPVVLPSQYRVQKDAPSGVNLNRNWDFFWETYAADPSYPPGDEAFSEVETQLVRDLFLSKPFAIALDCHNYDASDTEDIKYVPPSEWLLSNRSFLTAVAEDWARVYANGDRSRITTMYPRGVDPMFSSWANYVIRHQHGRLDGIAAAVEAPSDLRGGTSSRVSRAGMQAYCGYLTTLLARWLDGGSALVDAPFTHDIYMYKRSVSQGVLDLPLDEGGGLISAPAKMVQFDYQRPLPGTISPPTDRLAVVAPYAPAQLTIVGVAEIAGKGQAGRATLQILIDGAANAWGAATVDISDVEDARYPVMFRTEHRIFSRDAETITRIQLRAGMSTVGPTATLRRCSLHVHVTPDIEDTVPTPYVPPSV